MERPTNRLFDIFPRDVAERVLSFLTKKDLVHVRLVNRQWKQFTDRYVTRVHPPSLGTLHKGHLPQRYPNLKAVDLSSVDIADDTELKQIGQRLAEIPKLRNVTLRCGPGVTENGWGMLDGILPQLQCLRLLPMHQGCVSSCAGHPCTAFDKFEVFPQLTGLDLSWNALTPSAILSIASLSRLEVLNLKNGVDVDDEAVEGLTSVPTLRVLNLSGTDVTDDGLMSLNELELEVLNLSTCDGVTDDGMYWLQHIRSLKKVDISNCHAITSAGIEQLTNLPDLTDLHMRGMKPLGCSSLSKMKRLASISLRDCGWVKDETLEDLARCKTLKSVCLRNCYQITDNGLKMLCRLPLLRSVHLRGCTQITDVGLNCLGASPDLEDIDLSFLCHITDAGLACLTQLTKLRRLILNWCSSVTATGLRRLQTACREVKELSIKGCHDLQLPDLVSMAKGDRLEKLDYEHCLCSVHQDAQKRDMPLLHRIDSSGCFVEIC